MSEYRFLYSGEINTLQRWHRRLDDNRGDRARLRRAERPEDVLLTEAFFNFIKRMPERWRSPNALFTSATIAGLLSHVKADRQTASRRQKPKDAKKPRKMTSFAEQLATSAKGAKAPMSELRFQQLQKSRTTDDFYRHVLRAIRLLGGQVNIISLADDIIHWHKEFNNQINRNPADRLAVRWAADYYTMLPKQTK